MATVAAPLTTTSAQPHLQMSGAILQQEVGRILGESGSLDEVGIVHETGSVNGMGSMTKQYSYMELDGQGGMTSVTEVELVGTSGLVAESVTLTCGRYAKRIPLSDQLAGVNKVGINYPMLAQLMVNYRRTQRNINICTALESATQVVGTSGAVLTVDTVYAALDMANENHIPTFANGYYVLLLSPKQVSQLRASARALTGPLRERADIQQFTRMRTGNVAGVLENAIVISHSAVQDDTTDFAGSLLGPKSVLGTHHDPPLPMTGGLAVKPNNLPGFLLEAKRTPEGAFSEFVANDWHGFTIRDERIIRVRSGV